MVMEHSRSKDFGYKKHSNNNSTNKFWIRLASGDFQCIRQAVYRLFILHLKKKPTI